MVSHSKPDLEYQLYLEDLFHKNQTIPRLRQEFEIPQILDHCKEHEIPRSFGVDLLVQMVLHKRTSVSTLVGILGPKHFSEGRYSVPSTQELQACADMLLKAAEADLVDWDDMARQFIIRIDVSNDVYDELERYQYPLPLVVEPRELKANQDTGYHSNGSAKGSVILRNNHHEDDVCLDHLNRVNRMPLTINAETAAMVQNRWRNLDRKKKGESQESFRRRVKAFEKYDRTVKDVLGHLYVAGNEFFLTHRYDKRGRCYAQGYHVNPQGNDWSKAIIEFAKKEIVT